MKSFFKYILFLILLNVGLVAKAETIYPIQLYATMLPPYTTCISDYITGGMNRLKLTAVVRDMNNHSFNQVRVLIQVKEGSEIRCTAYTYPAILGHGSDMMHEIPVTALNEQIINSNSKNGSKNGCLEEGAYEFVFQVFDAHNSSLPLSEPVSIYCYLTTPVPPVCIYPNEGDCINPTQNGGIINFTWMDAVASNLNRKEYVFELLEDIIPEAPSTSTLNPMFGKEDVTGKKVIFRTTIFNSNVYTLTNTVGLLNAGHKYYWHVKNVTDANDDNYSNNADRYSELASFSFGDCEPDVQEEETKNVEAIADKLVITNVETDSKNVSATITWGLEGAEDATALEKFCSYKLYFTRKKDTKESGEATTASESNGENQESEENTPKEDSKVKSVDDINDEFVVEVGNVNTYTITSVERTRKYDVTVEGYVCDENNKPYQKTEKSESKEFMIPQLETEECNSNIKQVECQSLVNLKNGDSFFANDDNVVVKVKELDLSKSNDETHVYSGKGIVTCTIFKEKLGLNVTFENIKVNSDHHLCDGVVNVVNSVENNVMVNLNDVAGKDRSASKALEQKEVKTAEKKEHVEDKKINLQYRDNIVTCDKTLYAVSNTGDAESVGTLTDGVTPSISSLDNENGVIEFDVEDGLKDNTCSPYIDKGAAPFQNKPIVDSYDRMGGSYIVPWLSMVAGDTKWIKAKPKKFNDNFKSKKQFLNLNFYARIAGKYYKLDSEMLEDNTYLVKVFGGEANKSYPIYAMSKDDSKTYGSANVYNMKYKEIKVKLVPVINQVNLVNSLEDYQNKLNKIFEPLGKKFIFNMDDKPFTDDDIKNPVDEHSKLDFLNDGLNTTEGNGIFANETKEMKLLRKLYQKNTSDDNSYDAYLFLIPKNTNYDIKGFMPRTYSVGYLFVGESGNSNAVQYNDIYTAAHELCHGVFGLQHTFDYLGVAQGVLGENLMDYSTADKRYPSKYFQWYNIENPSDYHFPFVDTPEDGESVILFKEDNTFVYCGGRNHILLYLMSKADEILDKYKDYKNLDYKKNPYIAVSIISDVLNEDIINKEKLSIINDKKEAQELLSVVLVEKTVSEVLESKEFKSLCENENLYERSTFIKELEKSKELNYILNRVDGELKSSFTEFVCDIIYDAYISHAINKRITKDDVKNALLAMNDEKFKEYVSKRITVEIKLPNNGGVTYYLDEKKLDNIMASKGKNVLHEDISKIASLDYIKKDKYALSEIIKGVSSDKMPIFQKFIPMSHTLSNMFMYIDFYSTAYDIMSTKEIEYNDFFSYTSELIGGKLGKLIRAYGVSSWAVATGMIVDNQCDIFKEWSKEFNEDMTWYDICNWSKIYNWNGSNVPYPVSTLKFYYVDYTTILFEKDYNIYNPNIAPTSIIIQDGTLAKKIFGFIPTHVLFNVPDPSNVSIPNRRVIYSKEKKKK